MTSRTHITAADLEGMSPEQIALFDLAFGGEMEITQKNIEIALDAGLDAFWFYRLLPEEVRAEYNKTRAIARAYYENINAIARADYDNAMAAAWTKLNNDSNAARAKYDKAEAPALAVALTHQEGK